MSESELQDAIAECARVLGWLVFHARAARSGKGWRTPVAYDGVGFPDLLMARAGRVIAAELKSATGKVAPAQKRWIDALRQPVRGGGAPMFDEGTHTRRDAGIEVYVWEPSRWLDGTIERVLR